MTTYDVVDRPKMYLYLTTVSVSLLRSACHLGWNSYISHDVTLLVCVKCESSSVNTRQGPSIAGRAGSSTP